MSSWIGRDRCSVLGAASDFFRVRAGPYAYASPSLPVLSPCESTGAHQPRPDWLAVWLSVQDRLRFSARTRRRIDAAVRSKESNAP